MIIHLRGVDGLFHDSALINIGLMISFSMRMAPTAFKTTTDSLLFSGVVIIIPRSLGPDCDYLRTQGCMFIQDRSLLYWSHNSVRSDEGELNKVDEVISCTKLCKFILCRLRVVETILGF